MEIKMEMELELELKLFVKTELPVEPANGTGT